MAVAVESGDGENSLWDEETEESTVEEEEDGEEEDLEDCQVV